MRKTLAAVAATVATAVSVCGALLLDGPPRRTYGTDAGRAAGVPSANLPALASGRPDKPGTEPSTFDRSAHSTTDPSSVWVIVNKTHPIQPSDFRPALSIVRGYQVADPAAGPLTRLLDASDHRGLGFKIASAFRSYDYQQQVHAATAAARGDAAADLLSARAGYSEHQTGLAVDLVTPADPGCDFEACFAGTPGGRWLAHSAWRFGFVVRYQSQTTAVTGYQPEPWHLRYVGRPLAKELHHERITTLEEFFGVPGGGYPPA